MPPTESQALTRPYNAASNLSKSTRLNVPQFLQKLYEMVNEPNNNDLIRWSDSGDSFIVLDHERFAREVLGRWFKHQNFQSFVRQLNMYGFHKIPSLQQGVLRSDSDTETWNFEHPHFRQNQPDLLCLISRKKQASQQAPPAIEDVPPVTIDTQSPVSPGAGTVLDLNAVVSGIQAIKRHQQTISADLNELKSSNQSLWQEALAARERHNKQQDMINRILKFLASVFGRNDGQTGQDHHHHDGVSPTPPLVRTQRLMIDGPQRSKKGVEVVEVEDDEQPHSPSSSRSDDGASAFAHIDSASTVSGSTSPQFTPMLATPSAPNSYFDPASIWLQPNGYASSNPPPPASTPPPPEPAQSQSQLELHRPQSTAPSSGLAFPTSTTHSSIPFASQEAVLQAAYHQLMHSPTQMQRFLEAIAQNGPNPGLGPDPNPPDVPQQNAIQAYSGGPSPFAPAPAFDYSTFAPDFSALLPKADDPPLLQQPSPQLFGNTERLSKAYQSKNEIDADVELMHANISRLVHNMGLDPSLLNQPSSTPDPNRSLHSTPSPAPPPASATPDQPASIPPPVAPAEFDYFDFLDVSPFATASAPTTEDPVAPSNITAFMDDVAADPEKAKAVATGRKRRSDAAELDLPPPTPPAPRAKKAKATA